MEISEQELLLTEGAASSWFNCIEERLANAASMLLDNKAESNGTPMSSFSTLRLC